MTERKPLPAIRADDQPWGPLASSGGARLALIISMVVWVFLFNQLNGDDPDAWERILKAPFLVLPVLSWLLVLVVGLLREGEFLDAVCAVVLSPLVLIANLILAGLLGLQGRLTGAGDFHLASDVLAIGLGLFWAVFGWCCYRVLMGTRDATSDEVNWRFFRQVVGIVETLLVILALGAMALIGLGPTSGHGYSVRSRVSELILAASSAKTALSEGYFEKETWSATWMSSITISATGMIASATIGPTGKIIVYGTKPTSFSSVTLTPTVTTDNKLVWSCVGSPSRYMPASCR